MTLLFGVVLIECGFGAFICLNENNFGHIIEKILDGTFRNYKDNAPFWKLMQNKVKELRIQLFFYSKFRFPQFECCGVKNCSDWQSNLDVYKPGCADVIIKLFKSNVVAVISCYALILIVQVNIDLFLSYVYHC